MLVASGQLAEYLRILGIWVGVPAGMAMFVSHATIMSVLTASLTVFSVGQQNKFLLPQQQ